MIEGGNDRGRDRARDKWRDKRREEFSGRIEGGSKILYCSPFKCNIETVKGTVARDF